MISAKFTLCWMSESGIRLNMRFIFLEIPEQWYFTHMRFFIIKKIGSSFYAGFIPGLVDAGSVVRVANVRK